MSCQLMIFFKINLNKKCIFLTLKTLINFNLYSIEKIKTNILKIIVLTLFFIISAQNVSVQFEDLISKRACQLNFLPTITFN